jgi:RimJ/RimL family protein N-acetyltransferase
MKSLLRAIGQSVFGAYQINRLYQLDSTPGYPKAAPELEFGEIGPREIKDLRAHEQQSVRKSAGYAGEGMHGFYVRHQGELASVAFYAEHSVFENEVVVPLRPSEAGLVELITLPEHRGKGMAPLVISYASAAMFERGFSPLVSWLWWTNSASQRAFEKAGWRFIGMSVQLYPFGRTTPLSFRPRDRRHP